MRLLLPLSVLIALALGVGGKQVFPSHFSGQADTAISSGEPATQIRVPEPSARAVDFYRSGNILWVINQLWELAAPAFILFTGLSRRLREWSTRLAGSTFLATTAYVVMFFALVFLLDLPLDFYRSFVRPHAYGLSNQSIEKWMADASTYLLIQLAGGVAFLWIPFAMMKKWPRRWWLYVGMLTPPFLAMVMLVMPIWIDPLFNDFSPLKDKRLEARIVEQVHRAGIEGFRVFEVNQSIDSKTLSAYVTGLLGTGRIVFSDTMLAKLDDRELLFVLGHEMGHYVLHHVLKSIFVASLLVLIGLYMIYRVSGPLQKRFGPRLGLPHVSDIAALPLFLLLINLFSLILVPIGNVYSRYQEREADRFGLEITGDNHAAASAFLKLIEENLDYPRPGGFYRIWRSTHPPTGERIDFCNTYHPWRDGQPLKYGPFIRGQ